MVRELHPTENRGYRELYAFTRQLADHWSALAERLGEPEAEPFEAGAAAARTLLEELAKTTAEYGLHGEVAAQNVGRSLAGSRSVLRDRFLERAQAIRLAVTEIQHVTMLLGFLAAVADGHSDEELAAFDRRWERKLRRVESAARKAAVGLGADPDASIEPVDASVFGKAAHGAAFVIGSIGEWSDSKIAKRRSGS